MQDARTVLAIMQERGKKGLPLGRVYRHLFNRELYLMAYGRIYIEKKHSTKKRPLSMPTWSGKLLQEVIRLLLSAYYEPGFSEYSHGFRPERGCHTALREIDRNWLGTTWFVEARRVGAYRIPV